MFRLNRNKQKTNQNSLISGAYFAIFHRKFWGFLGFKGFLIFSVLSGLFRKRLFRLFRFYTETESFDVSIEPKQTEDPPKQFEREYIWVISENLGLFRFVLVCYETVLFVSVCFGSNRNLFLFVSRTL
jgi:hypothetical protein